MNAVAVVIKKLKAVIAKLNRQIAIGARNARKYVLKLIDAENKLEAMSDQLDSFAKLKKDVCSRLNEAAWKHLQKWACDPYRKECNEQWYLSKLRPESQPIFQEFQDRYEELELADFRKDEEEEAVRLAALPEISDNEKARRDFGFGFLPSGM